MTDILHPTITVTATMPDARYGLQLFADGSYEPVSRRGGWAFIVYRDAVEIAFECGGAENSANNAMEAMALLNAVLWISSNAAGEPAVIWSDSLYAVNGCNSWLPIWKQNGWKKIDPNPKARRRTIADPKIWKAIDIELSRNQLVTIAWCKGHFGIDGNERADELAEKARRATELA